MAVLPPAAIFYVQKATATYRYPATDVPAIPAQRVAIVFGAGVRPDGSLTPMLRDRVEAAVDLYQTGKAQKLLMTGDNSEEYYDEVTAMKRYAVARGVPAEDITLDYAGFSTYESCFRARAIFGVQQGLLITQDFHLPRAVYTCRQLGIDAVGVGTPDWERYSRRVMEYYTVREYLATFKALWDVHITLPPPTYLGPFEGIS
jgi:vancomycin permeability regulator SanA